MLVMMTIGGAGVTILWSANVGNMETIIVVSLKVTLSKLGKNAPNCAIVTGVAKHSRSIPWHGQEHGAIIATCTPVIIANRVAKEASKTTKTNPVVTI